MEIITKVKLVAGKGMYLTKKNQDENQEPLMFKVADLNVAENPDDWTEILIEEGDAIMAQWQAEQERKIQEEDTLIQEQQITDTTLNNSINYIPPMEIFKGKHYIQDGIVYECIRNSEKLLDNNLCNLIGLYVYKI